jgi:hypothetical protein
MMNDLNDPQGDCLARKTTSLKMQNERGKMMFPRMTVLLALAWCSLAVTAQTPKCINKQTETRLGTLQVETCLAGTIDNPNKPPLITEVRQTLRNLSDKPIELELFDDVILRLAASISTSADGREVSKRASICPTDTASCMDSGWGHQLLAPRKEREYRYNITDLMTESPQADVAYFIGVNANYAYRFWMNRKIRDIACAMRRKSSVTCELSVPVSTRLGCAEWIVATNCTEPGDRVLHCCACRTFS